MNTDTIPVGTTVMMVKDTGNWQRSVEMTKTSHAGTTWTCVQSANGREEAVWHADPRVLIGRLERNGFIVVD